MKKIYTTADFLPDDRVAQEKRQGKVVGTRNGFVVVLWDGESQCQHVHPNTLRPIMPEVKKRKQGGKGKPFQPGHDPRRFKLTPEHGKRGYEATVEKFIAQGMGEYHAKKRTYNLICKKEQGSAG